jgi:hypothetical protein
MGEGAFLTPRKFTGPRHDVISLHGYWRTALTPRGERSSEPCGSKKKGGPFGAAESVSYPQGAPARLPGEPGNPKGLQLVASAFDRGSTSDARIGNGDCQVALGKSVLTCDRVVDEREPVSQCEAANREYVAGERLLQAR